jgi:uncharacterized protein (TIGR00730 family)
MRRICVFCGSSAGDDPRYLEAAAHLGQAMASQGIQLVYGGSVMGMMGRLAGAVQEAGGEVIGIIPGVLLNRELPSPEISQLHVVKSMHERKTLMAELSDAFVALPGGLGTLEAFCELLTWGQLGLHRKPCGILNTDGFFNPLIQFFDHSVREGFLEPRHRRMVVVESRPTKLLDLLRAYEPPVVPRWIAEQET